MVKAWKALPEDKRPRIDLSSLRFAFVSCPLSPSPDTIRSTGVPCTPQAQSHLHTTRLRPSPVFLIMQWSTFSLQNAAEPIRISTLQEFQVGAMQMCLTPEQRMGSSNQRSIEQRWGSQADAHARGIYAACRQSMACCRCLAADTGWVAPETCRSLGKM